MCNLSSSSAKQMFHSKPWRLKSRSLQSYSQRKACHWTFIWSQTHQTWWKRKDREIRRKNIQTYSWRSASGTSSSLGRWRRTWDCHHSFSWRSLSQKNWSNLWTWDPKPRTLRNRQIYSDRFRWLLGCDDISWSLWLCWPTWRQIDSSKCLSEWMQSPLVVKQQKQEERLKNRWSSLPQIRPRWYQRSNSLPWLQICKGRVCFLKQWLINDQQCNILELIL